MQFAYLEGNVNTEADMTIITASKEMEEEHLLNTVSQLADP